MALQNLPADIRYAFRSMRSAPGFAATAVGTLILGIGATTAIFSVVHAVLFRPLPYHDPQRLVHIVADDPSDSLSGLPRSVFETLSGKSRTLEHLAIYYRNTGLSRVIVGGRLTPEQVQAGFVSNGLFPLLGVAPLVGRAFDESEVRQSALVAVLSHTMWQKRFGGASDVIGKSIEVDDRPFTIIGVMPPRFQFPASETQLWMPMSTNRYWMDALGRDSVHTRGYFMRWNLAGRLRPGATAALAQSELSELGRALAEADKDWNMGLGVKVKPLSIEVTDRARLSLGLLMGAVALVLLIACANVANLLLARGVARSKEMAVRLALGASRTRIVQQTLTESVALVALASVAALLLADWLVRRLVQWGPADIPRLDEASINVPVMVFAFTVALLTAILFGSGPALQAAAAHPLDRLRSGAGRGLVVSGLKTSAILIVAEFAVAIVLATTAGLLLRSLWNAESVDPGFQADRVLSMRIQYPSAFSASQRTESFRRIEQHLSSLPGVERVGGISNMFELGEPPANSLRAVDGEPPESDTRRPLSWTTVSGGYFQAMGIPLVSGRQFSERDQPGSGLVAVIDERMAQRYWPGRDPIGKRFKGQDRRGANDEWITVIGVVKDARRQGVERNPTPHVFLWHQQSEITADWVIRTSVRPGSLVGAIRRAVLEVEPRLVINNLAPVGTLLAAQTAQRRFQTWLLTLFASLALGLAAVGIFGVMSHAAARRTHEIGIRMALGADRFTVIRMILARGIGLAIVGLAVGAACSLGASRLLTSLLFGVTPADSVTHISAAALLLFVAAGATFIPAWRASRVDPLVALRKD